MALKAVVNYANPELTDVEYRVIEIDGLTLNADPINQYFRDDTMQFADSQAVTVSKGLVDLLAITESSQFDFATSKTDAMALYDEASLFINPNRSDSASLSDAIDYLTFGKNPSDSGIFVDSAEFILARPIAEDFGAFTESGVLKGQDYCNLDYFLDDYVGFINTF